MKPIAFLESFNAKTMQLKNIVDSFVTSEHFDDLAGVWNSLLIGPRGSGKTTLLRMLEPKALRLWSHPDAENYRNAIQYTGIYVPSDVAWGAMVDSLEDNGKLNPDCYKLLSEAAFITSVFQACISALEDRLTLTEDAPFANYKVVSLTKSAQEEVLKKITRLWRLTGVSLSFSGLREALKLRMVEIKDKARELVYKPGHNVQDLFEKIPYANLPVEECVEAALGYFDEAIGERDSRWALLFDEFEIVPFDLQKVIMAKLRSTNSKIIYKIALAPCGHHTQINLDSFNSDPINDYKPVTLWYKDKNATLKFCSKLLTSKISNDDSSSNILEQAQNLFGKSIYADVTSNEEDDTPKSNDWNGKWEAYFISLEKKDKSFKDFLTKKNIDASNLNSDLSIIRKIAPLVAFREAFIGDTGVPKAPKNFSDFYTGWEAFATISEGNPRWFIGMLNTMLSEIRHRNLKSVPKSVQFEKINTTTDSYCAMLKLLAKEHKQVGLITKNPVFTLLKDIGDYFHERIIKHNFAEEMPLSFVVDKGISLEIENILKIAFNHGAIVCLSEHRDTKQFHSLTDLRFRLAYLLAPELKLPLRGTKEIALSTILRTREATKAPHQGSLI